MISLGILKEHALAIARDAEARKELFKNTVGGAQCESFESIAYSVVTGIDEVGCDDELAISEVLKALESEYPNLK